MAGTQGVKRAAAVDQGPVKKNKLVMTNETKMKKQLHIGSNEIGYEMKANYFNFNAMDKIFEGQLWINVKKKVTSRLMAMYAGGQKYRLTCDLTYAYRKFYPIATDAELIMQAVKELKEIENFSAFELTDEHLQMDDGSPEITEKLFNESPVAKELDEEMYFTKDQISHAVDSKSHEISEKFKKFMNKYQPNRRTDTIEAESLRVVDCMLHRMKNEFKGIVRSALFGISSRQINDVIGKPIMIYFEPRMVPREIRSSFLTSMGAISVQLPRTVHNLALAQFDNVENFSNMLKANGTILGGSRIVVRVSRHSADQNHERERDDQDGYIADTTQDLKEESCMEGDDNFEGNDEDDEVIHHDEY